MKLKNRFPPQGESESPAEEASVRFGRIIHQYRTARNLSQSELASLIHADRNSVVNWENGRSRPPIDAVPRLCDVLRIPLELFFDAPYRTGSFTPEEADAVALYHRLNAHDREIINSMIESLRDAHEERLRRRCLTDFLSLIPIEPQDGLFPHRAIRGTGSAFYVRRSSVSEAATHVALVEGDDMSPDYPDGSRVYVRRTEDLKPGETVLVSLNGCFYVRELRTDCLHALNPKCSDISLAGALQVCMVGKVLSCVSAQDLPSGKELEMLEAIARENRRT